MRFNSTGREDTTNKVLRPQNGGAGRRAALIAVVVCVAMGLVWVSYSRSGVSLRDVFNDKEQASFGSQQTGPTTADTK
jgi:hypothetical protein